MIYVPTQIFHAFICSWSLTTHYHVFNFLFSNYSKGSCKRPPQEFENVVVTRGVAQKVVAYESLKQRKRPVGT